VREAIWRKVEHNQEMVRMCDEALASLNTAPAGDDVRRAMPFIEAAAWVKFNRCPREDMPLDRYRHGLVTRLNEGCDIIEKLVAALKATTHTEERA
jgi:hypothetical protein